MHKYLDQFLFQPLIFAQNLFTYWNEHFLNYINLAYITSFIKDNT